MSSTCSWWCVQAAIVHHVGDRASHRQRGGLQVPPQHADGEEAPSALQGEDPQLFLISIHLRRKQLRRLLLRLNWKPLRLQLLLV